MRTLYTFDKHNYSDDMEVFERFAVRAVIIRDGKLAMQQAGEGYYKILGGGIDAGETNEVALAREVKAERVMIEYNGMWLLDDLYAVLPNEWTVAQEMTFADSSFFHSCSPTFSTPAAERARAMMS